MLARRAVREGADPAAAAASVAAAIAAKGSAKGKSSGGRNAFEESLEAMHERGEKLEHLGDHTAQMANDAEDFMARAKQLRKQNERKFFGLF